MLASRGVIPSIAVNDVSEASGAFAFSRSHVLAFLLRNVTISEQLTHLASGLGDPPSDCSSPPSSPSLLSSKHTRNA